MGYPVFFSDQISKQLLAESPEVKIAIQDLLGADSYINNQVNTTFIAQKVFSDKLLLKQMNAIIHPAVRASFSEWADDQNSNLVFNEAAILFETNGYQQFDKTILVTAPNSIKIKRVLDRDKNMTVDAIEERMKNQWSDDQKIPLADYIIRNDENDMLLPQILEILEDLNQQRG